MSVFKLTSDNQFIRSSSNSNILVIWEFPFILNRFDFSKADCSLYIPDIVVDPEAPWSRFKALEVWGVKIEGDQILKLIEDLAVYDGQPFHLWVNRQGMCYLRLQNDQRNVLKRVRINDCFVWSKYGVKVPEASKTTWRAFDIINGDTLFAPRRGGGGRGVEECWGLSESWKKMMEEKEKMMEEKVKMMEEKVGWLRKALEEKEREVSSLKAVVRTLSSDV